MSSSSLTPDAGRRAFARTEDARLSDDETRSAMRELRRRKRNSFLLVAPLLIFLMVTFFAPIASMLYRSVYNPTTADLIPTTLTELNTLAPGTAVPPEIFTTFALELKGLTTERKEGILAANVNQVYPGASSLIKIAGRRLRNLDDAAIRAKGGQSILLDANPDWANNRVWSAIDEAGRTYTDRNYLKALGFDRVDGHIERGETAQIYIQLYGKTLGIALAITVLCILLGYPLAYYLATAPRHVSNALMVLVLLPFWTSLLVRTTSWIALLQADGVINSVLLGLGIVDQPVEMLYTRFATIVAMTHILIPFMILPLYSVMRGIDPSYVRAALSMGSSPFSAFRRVFLPLTLPGLSAGTLLVFIVSVGYYITPALVGGSDGQMISNIIAFNIQRANNWGLAAALGSLLLALILLLYWVYDRLVGAGNIKLG